MLVEKAVGVNYMLKMLSFEMEYCIVKMPVVNTVAEKIHHSTDLIAGCCLSQCWNWNMMGWSMS